MSRKISSVLGGGAKNLALVAVLLLTGLLAQAQDLGPRAYSTLTWADINSYSGGANDDYNTSIGLTKDGRVYTWGGNYGYIIHTGMGMGMSQPNYQVAPFWVKFPVGETPVKVSLGAIDANTPATYFCLTASGKMYAWGYNRWLAGSGLATFPIQSTTPSFTDTTKAARTPVLMTNIGEATFVDMDYSLQGFGVIVGASGKAYHIGLDGSGIAGTAYNTFAVLPNPAGVSASFKYIRVWVSDLRGYNGDMAIYLKGNDGNIYFTGKMASLPATGLYASGVPAIYARNSPAPTLTTNETNGAIRSITPRQVPFPAGEDIVHMHVRSATDQNDQNYAIGASGKAYVAGRWRYGNIATASIRSFVTVPIKAAPSTSVLDVWKSPNNSAGNDTDTLYILKEFTEVAMPPGATKVLSIIGGRSDALTNGNNKSMIVGDDNKVYWSGFGPNGNYSDMLIGNYLVPTPAFSNVDKCNSVIAAATNSYYSWGAESIIYQGAAKLFRGGNYTDLGIISASGRGYFVGKMSTHTGTGKTYISAAYIFPYPVPIANELLLSCNTSPGTGGPGGPSSPGVGIIDCSKTKLLPAPVAGVASQLNLQVTINVTTVGSFSPLSVSGSGMSLGNGIASVTTTTTGLQTFSIPINYDGSTLTNTFQFTIGQAGGCTADLTTKPNNEITKVWSLTNCSAITPGVLSK